MYVMMQKGDPYIKLFSTLLHYIINYL